MNLNVTFEFRCKLEKFSKRHFSFITKSLFDYSYFKFYLQLIRKDAGNFHATGKYCFFFLQTLKVSNNGLIALFSFVNFVKVSIKYDGRETRDYSKKKSVNVCQLKFDTFICMDNDVASLKLFFSAYSTLLHEK